MELVKKNDIFSDSDARSPSHGDDGPHSKDENTAERALSGFLLPHKGDSSYAQMNSLKTMLRDFP